MVTTSVTLLLLRFQVCTALDPFGNVPTICSDDTFLFTRKDQRWYMFQNMGPAPSVRSGHRMATVGTRVFVLGGVSSVPGQTDDSSIIHVLDTSMS